MQKEEKISQIMGIVKGIKPIDGRLPVFEQDEAGNLVQTGEFMDFAPIPGGIIIKCHLTEKDKKEIEQIENGI